MRLVLVLLLCFAQLACAGFPVQTDRSQTPLLPQGYDRLAVWGSTPSMVGAATTWLQERGVSVIERTRLLHIMTEQKVRLTMKPDREGDLLAIGKRAGASLVVFADFDGIPDNANVTIRAVDVESAVVLWSGSAQYTGSLVHDVDYVLAGLTCEALATAWGFRRPGWRQVKESEHCQTPRTIHVQKQ